MYEFMVCDDQQCLPPEIIDVVFYLKKDLIDLDIENISNVDFNCSNEYKRSIKGLDSLIIEEESSLTFKFIEALIAGIIAGLIALVTPCVSYDSIDS